MALDIQFHKNRHPIRWIVAILLIALLVAGGWFGYRWYTTGDIPLASVPLVNAGTIVDESMITPLQVSQYTVTALRPRYIKIPSLDVGNTRIYPVRLDTNNLLEYPSNIHDVGWYEKSDTPGGGTVILLNSHSKGIHENNPLVRLKNLHEGDLITLERGDGKLFNYKVVENEIMTIDKVNDTGMKRMGQPVEASAEGLNIIADDGTWIPKLGTFDRRIMLRAVITE